MGFSPYRRGCDWGPRCHLGSKSHCSGAAKEGSKYEPARVEDLGQVLCFNQQPLRKGAGWLLNVVSFLLPCNVICEFSTHRFDFVKCRSDHNCTVYFVVVR